MILAGNISPVQGGVYKYIAPRRSVLISTTRSSCMSCICASTDQVDGFPNVKRGEHSNNTGIWKIIPSLYPKQSIERSRYVGRVRDNLLGAQRIVILPQCNFLREGSVTIAPTLRRTSPRSTSGNY